jgi:Polyketide synthase dehydratase
MVVEAAKQQAQLRDIYLEQIDGFRLREILVSKALIFDYGAQYETIVSLRPYAESTRSDNDDWNEFRISSWTSTRGWLEHCRGLVGVKKQRTGNSVNNAQL